MVDESPFATGASEGVMKGSGETEWVVSRDRHRYDEMFYSLNPVDGRVPGSIAKPKMVASKLPNSVLGRVWKLADVDRDGALDIDEWALAQHLIAIKLEGHDLPAVLPSHLVPPSKRQRGAGAADSDPTLYPKLATDGVRSAFGQTDDY